MAKTSKLTASYLAGLIDGEGYLGIMKMKPGKRQSTKEYFYLPVIKVAMTDKDIISWLYNSFGGSFETRKAHGNAKESYCWTCRKGQVKDFLKIIHLYLRVKKKQSDILFRFFAQTNGPGHKLSEEHWKERDNLYEQIKKMNSRGAV